jgi:cyclic-di-AMP phosphodiesterase PgpH
MGRWWLDWVRRLLQSLLAWIDQIQGRSPRTERGTILSREVHVPTPLVTAGAAIVLFLILVPETGLTLPHILFLLGLLSLLVFFFVVYFRYDLPQFVNDDEAVFLTGFCVVLGVLLIEIGQEFRRLPFSAIPVGSIAIVVTLLLHVRLALLINMVLALIAGVLQGFSLDAMIIVFFPSCAAMLAAQKVRHRSDITRAGFHVAWVTYATILGLQLVHNGMPRLALKDVIWALTNGAFCALIPLGLLPILESFFSRITPITLLEVGDFNRPLLRRLMLEAPGTYHHTLLVAALAEQAAEAIGANSLLCRVGMYYHDVGKLLHPEYFIENQTMRRSPKDKAEHHDKINPSISSLVIMSHVKDGIALARAHKVPEEVLRFIPEHHGTSLIKYFYMRALEQDEEGTPPADAFRYPGPRPHSRETVIGMLADSVEAASRTIEEPTYERLKDLVEKIVNSKFMDGQFDNAPVTLADLRKIIDSFASSLSAIYHVRIEYPEFPDAEQARILSPGNRPKE